MKVIEKINSKIEIFKLKKRRGLICQSFKSRNKNTDFTIISQNCVGGG